MDVRWGAVAVAEAFGASPAPFYVIPCSLLQTTAMKFSTKSAVSPPPRSAVNTRMSVVCLIVLGSSPWRPWYAHSVGLTAAVKVAHILGKGDPTG